MTEIGFGEFNREREREESVNNTHISPLLGGYYHAKENIGRHKTDRQTSHRGLWGPFPRGISFS
jgi:hypothetical protein